MKQRAGATHDQWVKDDEHVEPVRAENLNDLKEQNSACYHIVVGGRQPRPATCFSIFPQYQSEKGVERFGNDRRLGVETTKTVFSDRRTTYDLSLRFEATHKALKTRNRIVDEHRSAVARGRRVGATTLAYLTAHGLLRYA